MRADGVIVLHGDGESSAREFEHGPDRNRFLETRAEKVSGDNVGQRGHTAAQVLTHAGRDVRNLNGGYRTWLAGTSTREAALTH